MQITTHEQNPVGIRAIKAIVDFDGTPEEILCVHVNGVDTGVRVRLDGTGDGVMFVVGDKMYRHPVGGSND